MAFVVMVSTSFPMALKANSRPAPPPPQPPNAPTPRSENHLLPSYGMAGSEEQGKDVPRKRDWK